MVELLSQGRDQTASFRSLVSCAPRPPPSRSSRPAAPPKPDEFTLEAKRIAKVLTSLSLFLSSIRRAYLNPDPPPRASSSAAGVASIDFERPETYRDLRALADKDRDEIDVQVKLLLGACMRRVKELERVEQVRAARPAPSTPALLSFLLPPAQPDLLAAHRASMTYSLSAFLSRVSVQQSSAQEERVRRTQERGRTLMGSFPASSSSAKGGAGAGGEWVVPDPVVLEEEEDGWGAGEEGGLTQEQVQMFEAENAALLESLRSDLQQIQRAEQSLLAISELQTQLVSHLTQQAETTARLYDEALASTGTVVEGNKQLRKARERQGSGRTWVVALLVGAGLALLFLDYYD